MACNCGNCDDCKTKPYGFFDTLITGERGVSVSSVEINGSGDLIVTFSDGTTQNAGSIYQSQWLQVLSIVNGDASFLNNRTYVNGDAVSVGGGGTTGWNWSPGSISFEYNVHGKVLFIKFKGGFSSSAISSVRLDIFNATELSGYVAPGGEQQMEYLEESGTGTDIVFVSTNDSSGASPGIYIRKATTGSLSAYADGVLCFTMTIELI